MSFHTNILICGACDQRQAICRGPCICLVDGVDSRHHAESGFCPHRSGARFGTGEKPEMFPPKVQMDAGFSEMLADEKRTGGCNCAGAAEPQEEP